MTPAPPTDAQGREITTQSMWKRFQSCQRSFWYRYERGLVESYLEESPSLRFGKAIHEALEWRMEEREKKIIEIYDRVRVMGGWDEKLRRERLVAIAMVRAYSRHIDKDKRYSFVSQEERFQSTIPFTNYAIWGVVDGILCEVFDGSLWIHERKTAAPYSSLYLRKLEMDFQMSVYTRFCGHETQGVVYEIYTKPPAKMAPVEGESDLEWEVRLAKAKRPGQCKRKMPESDDEFLARLASWYDERPERMLRTHVIMNHGHATDIEDRLRELTHQLDYARRTSTYTKNTSACYDYGRECPYMMLCEKNNMTPDEEQVDMVGLEVRDRHEELELETTAKETGSGTTRGED